MQIQEWVNSIKASQLMVSEVVTLKPHHVLSEAAAILLRERISGAPVVDEFGPCQGVLSIIDIIHAEEVVAEQRQQVANSSFWSSNLALPSDVYSEKLEEIRDKVVPAGERAVSRFMTTNLITVDEESTLHTVVHHMVDAHVHRVLVVNEGRSLKGIISTTDVLATLLRAGEGG